MSLLWLVSLDVIADYQTPYCVSEQQKAMQSLQKIEAEWPTRGSGDMVSEYVQKLGLQLAHFSAYGQNLRWQFVVVRNLATNAFSIGDGYVFITDGAIKFVQNESELASILAHELGHQLAGHFCSASERGESGGFFDIFSNPNPQQHQVGVGSMTQVIDPIKEQQADQIALSILQAAGYNPRAMLDVARRMPANAQGHLMDISRIQSLEYTLANMPPRPTINSQDFQNIKRTLASE